MTDQLTLLRDRFRASPFLNIQQLEARAVRVPLARPVGASGTMLASRDYLCVTLRFSDGSEGIGFSYIGTAGAETALTSVREFFAPVLFASDVHGGDPFALNEKMVFATRIQGRSGILMNAISAIDIAMWDACARREDVSLGKLLGAQDKQIPTYGSGGYYYSDDGVAELEQELQRWQEMGFSSIKLKVRGDQTPSEFLRLAMARDMLGVKGNLMLDFYHAFSGREQAWRFVDKAQEVSPYWIEDPFEADDLASFSWLARQSGLRLATGEFQSNAATFHHIGLTGAASVVQAEAPRCGGVTGWLKLSEVALHYGMSMSPCWFHQLHVHLVPSVPNGGFVEYFVGTDVLNFDRLIDTHLVPKNGLVSVPKAPGLGFNFDKVSVEKYTIGLLQQ